MMKKMKGNPRLDAALVELAEDFSGRVVSHEMADKITKRVLGDKAPAKPVSLSPEEIRALREEAHMSQLFLHPCSTLRRATFRNWSAGQRSPRGQPLRCFTSFAAMALKR